MAYGGIPPLGNNEYDMLCPTTTSAKAVEAGLLPSRIGSGNRTNNVNTRFNVSTPSVTVTVMENVPVSLTTVPLNVPPGDIVRPDGRPVADHVLTAPPPVAANRRLNGSFTSTCCEITCVPGFVMAIGETRSVNV